MPDPWDLVFVTDATASMGEFLDAVRRVLPQVFRVSKLTGAFTRVGILWYRDYCDGRVTSWSGFHREPSSIDPFVAGLSPSGGGDMPEAAKTALVQLSEVVEGPTIVVWYADAPPHSRRNGGSNYRQEMQVLSSKIPDDPGCNWSSCMRLPAQVHVFPVVSTNSPYFPLLAQMTGGQCLLLREFSPEYIMRTTVSLLTGIMGMGEERHFQVICDELAADKKISDEAVENAVVTSRSGHYLPLLDEHARAALRSFDSEPEFRNATMQMFKSLLTPEGSISLTYNPVFGELWRKICRLRNDPRRDSLVLQLEGALEKASASDRQALRDWLESSYKRAEEVRERIAAVPKFPAWVLDADVTCSNQEVLEIARSCNRGTLAKMASMLTGLRFVPAPEGPADPEAMPDIGRFVPDSLPDAEFFALLPHLLAEGSVFSLRPSVVLAAVVLTSGVSINALAPKARRFLSEVRGTWFDSELPENSSFEFAKLALRCPEDAMLTSDERRFFRRLALLGGLISNGKTGIAAELPSTPYKTPGNDYHESCPSCGHQRSFTLMLRRDDGQLTCGICQSSPEYSALVDVAEPDFRSFWCECHVCHVNYAVVGVDLLNVRPKCHGCRVHQRLRSVECRRCRNRYLDQAGCFPEIFDCPRCIPDRADVATCTLELCAIFAENREAVCQELGISLADGFDPFAPGASLFKGRNAVQELPAPMSPAPGEGRLFHSGKPIVNAGECLRRIREWVLSGNAELRECITCFREVSPREIFSSCGKPSCAGQSCRACLTTWYSQATPGGLVLPRHLGCPFCAGAPSSKVLANFARPVCALVRAPAELLDASWYYAWCLKCYRLRPAQERACTQEIPEIRNFVCQECANSSKETKAIYKPCPACEQPTEKLSGCAHITCVCGAHWCYECGGKFSVNEIYPHIYRDHLGYESDEG
ncbi:MAG: hypothetical protein ACYCOU_05170 [Sulfobacillus sp.]